MIIHLKLYINNYGFFFMSTVPIRVYGRLLRYTTQYLEHGDNSIVTKYQTEVNQTINSTREMQ